MAAVPYYGAPPQAAAPAPAPLAVVSPQFCAPYAVPLTVTKKAISRSGRDFSVTDANGVEMLRVNGGAIFSIHDRRVLLDAAGQPLLSMREKVFSMHNRWEVFRGDSTNASDLLFTAKKASIFQLKPEVDVFLAGNSEQVCDFKVKGSYFERSCSFYLGNSDTMVAQINGKYTATNILLGKDTFVVTVFPYVDYVFITAVVVILDEIQKERFDGDTILDIVTEM